MTDFTDNSNFVETSVLHDLHAAKEDANHVASKSKGKGQENALSLSLKKSPPSSAPF